MGGALISFDEATALIAHLAVPLGEEIADLAVASGRILARPVQASLCSPRSDVSAMDGYAVRDADVPFVPARLRIVGAAFAGTPFAGSVGPGEAVRIFTGAYLPVGADRVVIQEICTSDGDHVVIDQPPGSGRHVRKAGSDFGTGEELLPVGTVLGPRQLVVAAASDSAQVAVFARPRIAILGTGDELVAPGMARNGPATIPDSLSVGLAAMAEQWGGRVVSSSRCGDALADLEAAAASAIAVHDVVIVTGGASVGERDHAKAMFAPQGLELLFSKVDIKPGKPVWLGRVGQTFVVGLPGNPSSAMVTARLFLAPLLARLSGRPAHDALNWTTMAVGAMLEACGPRETFVRARWFKGRAHPLAHQDSGAQAPLAQADLLMRRRPNAPKIVTDETADVLDF